MLEAITLNVANAAYARVETQKLATQPAPVRALPAVKASVAAPYVSPYVIVDESSSKAILAVRDSATGNITRQYPTENQIRAYQRTEAIMAAIVSDARGNVPEAMSAISRPKTARNTDERLDFSDKIDFADGAESRVDTDDVAPRQVYVPIDMDA